MPTNAPSSSFAFRIPLSSHHNLILVPFLRVYQRLLQEVAVPDTLPTNALLSFCFQNFLLPSRHHCGRHTIITIRFLNCILTVCWRLLQGVADNAKDCISYLLCIVSLACWGCAPLSRLIRPYPLFCCHSSKRILHYASAFPHASRPLCPYPFTFFLAPSSVLRSDTALTK